MHSLRLTTMITFHLLLHDLPYDLPKSYSEFSLVKNRLCHSHLVMFQTQYDRGDFALFTNGATEFLLRFIKREAYFAQNRTKFKLGLHCHRFLILKHRPIIKGDWITLILIYIRRSKFRHGSMYRSWFERGGQRPLYPDVKILNKYLCSCWRTSFS